MRTYEFRRRRKYLSLSLSLSRSLSIFSRNSFRGKSIQPEQQQQQQQYRQEERISIDDPGLIDLLRTTTGESCFGASGQRTTALSWRSHRSARLSSSLLHRARTYRASPKRAKATKSQRLSAKNVSGGSFKARYCCCSRAARPPPWRRLACPRIVETTGTATALYQHQLDAILSFPEFSAPFDVVGRVTCAIAHPQQFSVGLLKVDTQNSSSWFISSVICAFVAVPYTTRWHSHNSWPSPEVVNCFVILLILVRETKPPGRNSPSSTKLRWRLIHPWLTKMYFVVEYRGRRVTAMPCLGPCYRQNSAAHSRRGTAAVIEQQGHCRGDALRALGS